VACARGSRGSGQKARACNVLLFSPFYEIASIYFSAIRNANEGERGSCSSPSRTGRCFRTKRAT
jgi:hypothetical protein